MDAFTFTNIVGRPPEQDDLDRANCDVAGTVGHSQCGICPTCGKPRFLCLTVEQCEPNRYHLKVAAPEKGSK